MTPSLFKCPDLRFSLSASLTRAGATLEGLFDDTDLPSLGVRAALEALLTHPCTDAELSDIVAATDGERSLPIWYGVFGSLEAAGALSYVIDSSIGLTALLRPTSSQFRYQYVDFTEDCDIVLSPFGWCRREGDILLI